MNKRCTLLQVALLSMASNVMGEEPTNFYIMGTGIPDAWDATTEMTFNETTQAFENQLTVGKEKVYLLFADAEPLIPSGTYYVMNANAGSVINAEAGIDAKGAPITFTFDAAAKTYTITGADIFNGKQWTVANLYEDMPGFFTISTDVDGTPNYLSVGESALVLSETVNDNAVDCSGEDLLGGYRQQYIHCCWYCEPDWFRLDHRRGQPDEV